MMLKKRHTMLVRVGHVTRVVAAELSPKGAADDNSRESLKDKQEEALDGWYMSREEIMDNSPSRKDGIDWKKETYLRKSYCTFLQDLGQKLKLPQITIATAIVFCHRFYLRQSHARNDRWTIATVCMFLAAKAEDTPRPLKDVILISYEIIHSDDRKAIDRIKQKEVYEQQKQLILIGERLVLTTLGFAFIIRHPYRPLIEVVKKFNLNLPNIPLPQVAWNFVNDGLRTLLCFQFKPHHIAAGAIFLAAKFLKVKLPSNGDKVWWQELDVTPRQLEEVSNQMLELYEFYELNRVPTSEDSEVDRGAGATVKSTLNEEHGQATNQVSSRSDPEHTSAENLEVQRRGTGNQSNDESAEVGSDITDHKLDFEIRDSQNSEQLHQRDNGGEVTNRSICGTERVVTAEDQDRMGGTKEAAEVRSEDDSASYKSSYNAQRDSELREGLLLYSPSEVIKMIDKDKVKAALEKRRKERGKMVLKKDVMDEDDLIERELEAGIELAVEDEKNKERRQSWSSPDHAEDNDEDQDEAGDVKYKGMKRHSQEHTNSGDGDGDASSLSSSWKRKMGSPPAGQPSEKRRLDSSYSGDLGGVSYANGGDHRKE